MSDHKTHNTEPSRSEPTLPPAVSAGDGPGHVPETTPSTAPSRGARVLRAVLYGVGGLVALVLGLVVVLLLVLQTGPGARWAVNLVARLANPYEDAVLQVGDVEGTWVGSLALYDVQLLGEDGTSMARVDTLALGYDLLPMLRQRFHLAEVRVVGPQVHARQGADGSWDLMAPFAEAPEPDTAAAPFAGVVEVDRVVVRDAAFTAAFYAPERDSTLRVHDVNVRARDIAYGPDVAASLDSLWGTLVVPGSAGPAQLQAALHLAGGRLVVDGVRLASAASDVHARGTLILPSAEAGGPGDLDFTLEAAPLDFRDINPFVPGLASQGYLDLTARADGTTRLARFQVDGRFSDGAALALEGAATLLAEGPVQYRLDGRVRGLDPAFFTGDPATAGQLNVDVQADLAGDAVDRLSGTAGVVVSDTRYADYRLDRTTLATRFEAGRVRVDLQTGLREARLTLGGTLEPFADPLRYDLEAQLAGLDLGRFAAEGSGQASDLGFTLTAEGAGVDPRTADATVRLQMAPSRINRTRLEAGGLQARLQQGALDFDLQLDLPPGRVAARGGATFGDEVAYRIYEGRFDQVDVAALAGDTTRSALSGTFALDGAGTEPSAMRLQARLQLQDTAYGPYVLAQSTVDAVLRDGLFGLDARADLARGGTFELAAAARPFDAVPTFDVTRGVFRNVDLGVASPAQQSDLNGTFAVQVRGLDVETMSLDARLDLGASQLNAQPIIEGRLVATLDQGALRLATSVQLPDGEVVLAGGGRPFAAVPAFAITEGRFGGIDLGALAGQADLQTDLNGTFALEARGTDPATMYLDTHLDVPQASVNGASLAGRMQAVMDGGQLRAGAEVDVAEGQVRLDASGRFLDEQPRYQVSGTVAGVDGARRAGEAEETSSLALHVGVEPETMTLRARLDADSLVYGGVRVDTADVDVRVAGGVVELDVLRLRSNVAVADGRGRVALFDTTGTQASDLAIDVAVRSLAPVRPLLEVGQLVLDGGTMRLRIAGPPGAPRLTAAAELGALLYDDLRLSALRAEADADFGADWTPRAGRAAVHLGGAATPALQMGEAQLEATYEDQAVRFSGDAYIDDRRDLQLSGRADLRPEVQQVVLDQIGLRFDEDRWQLRQPATIAYGDTLCIDGLHLAAGAQEIVADGQLRSGRDQDLSLRVEQFRLGAVTDLLGYDGLDGRLSTTLDLGGSAAAPRLDGTLSADLSSYGERFGDVQLDFQYDSLRLGLDALLTHQNGSTLQADGFLPFYLTLAEVDSANVRAVAAAPVDLSVESDSFAVDWVRPFVDAELVSTLEGWLAADLAVGGTMDAPALDGTLHLRRTEVGLPLLGVTYEDITFDALFDRNRLQIEGATVRAGDGTLTARGSVEMPALTLGRFDVVLQLEEFRAISNETYHATVSGEMEMQGTTQEPLISGQLDLYDADVYLDYMEQADVEEVQLTDDDLLMLENYFGYRVRPPDTTRSDLFLATGLNLVIKLDRDTWVRQTANPRIAIEMTGDIEIKKAPYEEDFQLFRSIDVIPQRSHLWQFGREFDITTGEFSFNGPLEEMVLNIKADYEVPSRDHPGEPEATISLIISGRLDDMTLDMESDPPMENTDMVSYIMTGQPAGEGFDLGAEGANLVTGQLTGLAEGLVGDELGLDVIRIEQDGLRGTRVTAGKYVSSRLYLGVNQPISLKSSSQLAGETTEVTAEYELFDWLLLRLLSESATLQFNVLGRYAFR
jgi:translocation and assembly module TamB